MMSKNRYIDTFFWDDEFIMNCDPIEKLLFMYFLSNPLTNIIGVYEITLRRIAFDTGIDSDMIKKILGRFEEAQKVYYFQNHIILANFCKHQNEKSPKILKGMDTLYRNLEPELKSVLFDKLKGIYTVSKGIDTLSYINTNINDNSNTIESGSICKEDHFETYPKKQLFVNSPVADFETFKIQFEQSPNYANYDSQHYYNAVKNWSSAKVEYSADWVAMAYIFVSTDNQKNKAVKKKELTREEIAKLAAEGKLV